MNSNKIYFTAKEVSDILGVSLGYAYKIVHSMNEELKKQGYITITGKLPKKYFQERYYGA